MSVRAGGPLAYVFPVPSRPPDTPGASRHAPYRHLQSRGPRRGRRQPRLRPAARAPCASAAADRRGSSPGGGVAVERVRRRRRRGAHAAAGGAVRPRGPGRDAVRLHSAAGAGVSRRQAAAVLGSGRGRRWCYRFGGCSRVLISAVSRGYTSTDSWGGCKPRGSTLLVAPITSHSKHMDVPGAQSIKDQQSQGRWTGWVFSGTSVAFASTPLSEHELYDTAESKSMDSNGKKQTAEIRCRSRLHGRLELRDPRVAQSSAVEMHVTWPGRDHSPASGSASILSHWPAGSLYPPPMGVRGRSALAVEARQQHSGPSPRRDTHNGAELLSTMHGCRAVGQAAR